MAARIVIEVAQADHAVRLSWLRAVLAEAGIACAAFDTAAHALWPAPLEPG